MVETKQTQVCQGFGAGFGSVTLIVGVMAFVAVLAGKLPAVPAEEFYADVRDYLPEGYVTDGSVDYKEHIQKCFDENAQVYFPGSNDPDKPMIYGSTAGLKTKPFSLIQFGPNAVLKRLPCFGDLLSLAPGTHLTGAVIDGNKYAHWPLVKDRPKKPYSFVIGHAVDLLGENVLKDCFVYNNAGIAFGAWASNNNKVYRCRAENCGFLEATDSNSWQGEHASADGFYFGDGSHNNIVKDCEAYDCSRWGFVIDARCSNNTIVDCRGGNLHFSCFGFIDVESAGPLNSLIRCQSPNSWLGVQGYHQDVFSCTASYILAEHASYPRLIGCTTTSGRLRTGEIVDDRMITPGRESPMISLNRVVVSVSSAEESLSVICSDQTAIVTNNVIYGVEKNLARSAGMLIYGAETRGGNLQSWRQSPTPLGQFAKPYYLRAYVDYEFKKQELNSNVSN